MKKRLLPIATMAIAAVTLTGCSGGSDDATNATTADGKLESLSVMSMFLSATAPKPDNEIETALEDLIGTKLDITYVPNSSYGDKLNIVLAGDDVPQVLVSGKTPGFIKSAEAGAFWDLTDYLPDYPNLNTTLPEVQKNASINGKVYGIFRMRDTMRTSVMVRADWLENLGLEMPKTTEDLYNVAKAFTEQDPDGNGQDDTYGLIVPSWPGAIGSNSPYDVIETWYGAGNRYTERDGKVIPNFDTDEWYDAVDFEKSIVDGGYINPDYATFDSAKWNEPFLNGKGGIIIDVHSRHEDLTKLLKDLEPDNWDKMVDFTGNLIGPDGEMHALPTTGYSNFLAIPKAQVKNEEQLRQVLSVLNEMNTPEAQNIENNGVEGVTYNLIDGKYAERIADLPEDLTNAVSSLAQLGTNVTGYFAYPSKRATDFEEAEYQRRIEVSEADYENAVFDPTAPYISKTYTAKGAQLDLIVSDARLKYLAGQISKDDLKKEVARWHAEGGDDIIAELNELIDADK